MSQPSEIPSLIASNKLTISNLFSSDSSLMDLRWKGDILGRYFSRTPTLLHSLIKLLAIPPKESDPNER